MPTPAPLDILKLPMIGHVTHLIQAGDIYIQYSTDADLASVYDFYLPILQRAGLEDTKFSYRSKKHFSIYMKDPRDKSTIEVQAVELENGSDTQRVGVHISKTYR